MSDDRIPGIAVEPADVDDADAVTDLWVDLAVDQRTHGSHLLPERNRTRIRETVVRQTVAGSLLVARADRVVGFAMVTVESGGFDQDVERGIVQNLYVRPAYRRAGVGGALLGAAEELLADRGVDVVTLEVMAANDDARRFYREHGYAPHRVTLEKPAQSDTHSKGDE